MPILKFNRRTSPAHSPPTTRSTARAIRRALPRNPDGVLNILDNYLRLRVSDGKKIAVIIDYAETIVPAGDTGGMSADDRNAVVILQRWAHSPHFRRADVTIVLVTESLVELNQDLVQHPGVAAITIPLPDRDERAAFVTAQLAETPLPEGSDVTVDALAGLTSGLKRVQLQSLLLHAARNKQPLTLMADWTDRLGWSPAAVTATTATFPLDDAYVELVAADGAEPGVTSVAVVVDDVDDAAERLRARGAAVSATAEGHVAVAPSAVNGVPMELRADDDHAAAGSGDGARPYRRINHVVVAVADDEAAKAAWAGAVRGLDRRAGHTVEAVHHVPVGIAWFGLTGSGTDAGALARFVERRGEGVYALALVVDDHAATVAAVEQRGAQIIRQDSSGQTFVHPKTTHGVLVDLVSERRSPGSGD